MDISVKWYRVSCRTGHRTAVSHFFLPVLKKKKNMQHNMVIISLQWILWFLYVMCFLGITQQPDGGFGGAATPQSPLVSPRMGHAQSPLMQQGNATFQSTPEINGWTQGNMNPSRWTHPHMHTHMLTHCMYDPLTQV